MLLTVDVEDWFQVENFKQCIPYSSWSSYELRVEKNTHRILDLLDSIAIQKTEDRRQKTEEKRKNLALPNNMQTTTDKGRDKKVLATFFVLGWIAERLPHLVREIHARGHEVASHGCHHELCCDQPCLDLEKDLCDSKKLLEDLISGLVMGYRAPSFSINDDILKAIEQCGYVYDSSYNSFDMHGRYGRANIPENGDAGIARKLSEGFFELPISNLKLAHRVLPWGGGGYFRLIPFTIFKPGVKSILENEKAYLFYMHPWEIDPGQPRLQEAPLFLKFRHYVNLDKTLSKLSRLIETFSEASFLTCRQYLQHLIDQEGAS